MGSSRWSDTHYAERSTIREAELKSAGIPTFAYSAATSRLPASERKAHATLEPKDIKVRESRDSETHPESLAIAVLFDVTGSMHGVPVVLQKKLPALMGFIMRKGYAEHPQILMGAIGDATCDRVPLQVGQFESGLEIDDNLTNLVLEGGGGTGYEESYDLGLYFLARKTAIDCFEKRGKRGYAFLIGDEKCRHEISREEVKAVLGDTLQADIPTVDIIAELEKKFDVYYIIPNATSHYNDPALTKSWVELLGSNVLRLQDAEGVCELIATTIGIGEGKTDIERVVGDLTEAGTGMAVASAVRDALVPVGAGKGTTIAVGDSDEPSGLSTL